MLPAHNTHKILLEQAIRYLKKKLLPFNIYQASHPIYYLVSWAAVCLGYQKLKCIQNKKIFSKPLIYGYIKGFLDLGYYSNYNLCPIPVIVGENIVVSWCNKGDFLENGSFHCRYFNKNSKNEKDIFWVLISSDNFIPLKLNNNIFIFSKRQLRNRSLFVLIKNFLFCLKNKIPWFVESLFAKKFSDSFLAQFNVYHLKKVFLPYEGQPWQHTLVLMLKELNKDIKIIGDLHSCLPPLPADFIKRPGAPDRIIVHGKGQKDIMVNALGWSAESIEVQPSKRFTSHNSADFCGRIFLPYAIPDREFVLNILAKIFHKYAKEWGKFHIKPHPTQLNSKEYCALIKEIEILQDKELNFQNKKANKISIVIGASSVVMECLARGIKILHIVNDFVFEGYDSSIWTEMNAIQIDQNLLQYEVQGKATYLDIRESPFHV